MSSPGTGMAELLDSSSSRQRLAEELRSFLQVAFHKLKLLILTWPLANVQKAVRDFGFHTLPGVFVEPFHQTVCPFAGFDHSHLRFIQVKVGSL
jgi:hypothetical protein